MNRIVIGFDGAQVKDNLIHQKCRGHCNVRHYDEYINAVLRIAAMYFKSVDHIIMPVRSCLSSTLKASMKRVNTEFVYVCQEDISLVRPFRLEAILNVMATDHSLGIVRPTAASNKFQRDYINWHCKYPMKKLVEKSVGELVFLECHEYSDQNHISTLSFYKAHVWPQVMDGDFMEHDIACADNFPGLSGHIWLIGNLDDGNYCRHNDGRNA